MYPQLQAWNVDENEWLRRISIVSLVRYSVKNAVFLPLDKILPLVSSCLGDHRHYVQTAVGWVLREMGPVERIGVFARDRATERGQPRTATGDTEGQPRMNLASARRDGGGRTTASQTRVAALTHRRD
ncbi:hypothetical protein BH18ACT13_BH18ACT13_16690 [soil metagenome]